MNSQSISRGMALTGALALAVLLAACSSSSTSDTPGSGAAGPGEAVDIQFAVDAIEVAYDGTWTAPPSSGPAAVPNKKIWYVSCGQLAVGCAVPAAAAQAAAEAIGWDFTIYDGAFNAENKYSTGIEQALVAGADGIIIGGIDCSSVQPALEKAKEQGVFVHAFQSWDCDDPSVGGDALFAPTPALSETAPTWTDYTQEMGRLAADWIIADSEGTGKVIEFKLQSKLMGANVTDGFVTEMERCSTCEVVEVVQIPDADVSNGQLEVKAAAAILAHPDADYIHVPLDVMTDLGVAGAMERSGRGDEIKLIAGEGYAHSLDALRDGGPNSAALYYSLEWIAWGLIDGLNRNFAGETDMGTTGVGFMLIDSEHNLPEEPETRPQPVDFEAAYRSIWGV